MANWKYRKTVLILMFIAWMICYLDRMIMSVSIPFIAKDFGLSPVSMGVVMSAFLLGYALLQIPGGVLADKFGASKVIVIALILWSLFTGLTGIASSLTMLLVIRVLFGVGEGLFPGPYYKIIATWFPMKERATANGIAYSSQPFGIAIASVVGASLIVLYGWRTLYFILAVPGILIALALWFYVADTPEKSRYVSEEELKDFEDGASGDKGNQPKASYASIMRVPIVWQLSVVFFFFLIANWGYIAWLPSYLIKQRGFTTMGMGIATALPFLAAAAGMAVGGFISDKFFPGKRKTYFCTSMLLSAVFCYVATGAETANVCVIFLTASGFFLATGMAAFWAVPMNTIPKEVMGLASSIISFFGMVGGFLAPIAIGYFIQASGGNYNYALGTIIFALVATVPAMLAVNTGGKLKTKNP
ncbi:MAG: MFS transporter [Deltaproteobacteria bacterium]|nr:MFS transporter [Deltaproteobacteria bacterium]